MIIAKLRLMRFARKIKELRERESEFNEKN